MKMNCACGLEYDIQSNFICDNCGHKFRFPSETQRLIPYKNYQQKSTGIVAVTSLKQDDKDHQLKCIDSWKSFGLDAIILDSERPSIIEMVDLGRSHSKDIVLINSDIELCGSNKSLIEMQARRLFGIGKRWNYDENNVLSEEQWGMDLFFIPSEIQLEDIGFRIGQPLWDYWIAWYVTSIQKKQFEWMPDRQLLHKDHKKRWDNADLDAAVGVFEQNHPKMDWFSWRSNFCPLKVNGSIAWLAIHSYKQDGDWNPGACSEWYYNQWKPMIPSYGCECNSEFKKIETENPPDFSSKERFYVWGVKVHNLVNKRLGKPQWTVSTEKN